MADALRLCSYRPQRVIPVKNTNGTRLCQRNKLRYIDQLSYPPRKVTTFGTVT